MEPILTEIAIDELGPLPVRRPASVAELCELVRQAAAAGQAVYPVGGRTMLDLGMPPTKPGLAVDMPRLDQVIDYPARDMTITVQAGITIASAARNPRQGKPAAADRCAAARPGDARRHPRHQRQRAAPVRLRHAARLRHRHQRRQRRGRRSSRPAAASSRTSPATTCASCSSARSARSASSRR